MNIGTLLPGHARYQPEKLAFVIGKKRLTYREFNSHVNQLANALLANGIRKGEKMATVLFNSLELMAAYWAAAKTGIVIVPCSPILQESGLFNLLADSETVFVLADSAFGSGLERMKSDLPKIRGCVLVGDQPGEGFVTYSEFISGNSGDNPPDADLSDSDVYNIMYSSGTTGSPKGIIHTHYIRAMYCSIYASAFRMTRESICLHAGSIVFNGAMLDLMPWMFVGCTYIVHESFNPEAVIRDIQEYRVTHMIMVPSQIIAILNSPAFDPKALESLEMIQSLGAPLHLEYKRRINKLLPDRFYELYGLTEGFFTVLDKHDAVRKVGSVGVPPSFYEMRILNDEGKECAPGEIGEICGKGPTLMPGYYKRPDLTHEAIVDGWLHSGDAGYVDEDGFLFLVDRFKDMIISGGVNVYPKDIEEIIIRHTSISEVAVFGVPNERWGETPVAAVVLREGKDADIQDLIQWTNSRVDAKFQRISDVIIMDAFPRNVAGKILKRELREAYEG
jgi:acyl-CoA synthetase (AMP-forming)/AMP-acid ligase II